MPLKKKKKALGTGIMEVMAEVAGALTPSPFSDGGDPAKPGQWMEKSVLTSGTHITPSDPGE